MDPVSQRLDTMEKNFSDMLEILGVIRDNMASKEDLAALEKRMDGKIERLEAKVDRNHMELEAKVDRNHTEMLEHVDGFIGLHKDQEQEIFALSARVERVEKKVDKVIS